MLAAHAGSMPELVSQADLHSVSQEVVKQQDFVGIGLRGVWVDPIRKHRRRVQDACPSVLESF
jgi:hypothetical protein